MNVSGSFSSSSLMYTSAGRAQASERISSGERINSAKDDAAGLAISNRASAQIRGFNQSIRNANDGVSMLQTAEGSLSSITENVQRLRELALQASNGTLNASDRGALNAEAKQLLSEVVRTVDTSSFNNQKLLSGDQQVSLQLGSGREESVSVGGNDFEKKLADLDFNNIDISTASGAQSALSVLDTVQQEADSLAANIGAQTNRLGSTINSLSNAAEQAEGARSRIRDADMAKEVTELVNNQVKQDASLAMLALKNNSRSNVLSLLGQ